MTTSHNPEYLDRRLQRMREEAFIEAKAAHGQYLGRGDVNNSRTHLFARQAAVDVIKPSLLRMAKVAFEITGDHSQETASALETATSMLVGDYINWIADKAARSPFKSVLPSMASVAQELGDAVAGAVDDFRHGIIGDERMAKDPVVNIVNTITSSPNAVVQNAVGSANRQSAEQTNLLSAIDDMLSSAEYKRLSEAEREGIQDVADVLRQELTKQDPEVPKIARWGKRLIEMCNDVGLQVAAAGIAGYLFK